MESDVGSILGMVGFTFALLAHFRIRRLEKKLKELAVLPAEFDSSDVK